MKKIILATVSSIALLGLAACSDTDTTTTQSVQPDVETTDPTMAPGDDTNVIIVPETTDDGVAADRTTTQSISPDAGPSDSIDASPDGTLGTDDVEPADDVPAVQ